ncbi:MAG: DUF1464 domain-containing protein [Desulfurococcales archaeon]|jgi:predicted butyrate kinase (DUF1464 family)|nr:DUF1464 domain-containing protein [Desulfurococcales archaeon]
MRKVLGIDPGSRSIDLCLLCDGEVCGEASIDTSEASKDPYKVVDIVESIGGSDLVVLPSGYGVEITYLDEIPEDVFIDWFFMFILISDQEEIKRLASQGVEGAFIYDAMAKIVYEFKKRRVKGVFIPGVINLPTIPVYKKINKIDMGAADKLAVTVLGVHELSEKHDVDYEDVNYIHVEMGYGYNAVIAVRNGRIVDGVGGSLMPGPAFLTSGSLDLEIVQFIKRFDKSDVFSSGCSSITKIFSLEEWFRKIRDNDLAKTCFESMIDSVVKIVYSMTSVVKDPMEILVSGRVGRRDEVFNILRDRLKDVAPVDLMRGLEGSKLVKETAQGYAVVGDGLLGGRFERLIRHMKINEATGSSLDYVVLPRFLSTDLGRRYLRLRKFLKSQAYNINMLKGLLL